MALLLESVLPALTSGSIVSVATSQQVGVGGVGGGGGGGRGGGGGGGGGGGLKVLTRQDTLQIKTYKRLKCEDFLFGQDKQSAHFPLCFIAFHKASNGQTDALKKKTVIIYQLL